MGRDAHLVAGLTEPGRLPLQRTTEHPVSVALHHHLILTDAPTFKPIQTKGQVLWRAGTLASWVLWRAGRKGEGAFLPPAWEGRGQECPRSGKIRQLTCPFILIKIEHTQHGGLGHEICFVTKRALNRQLHDFQAITAEHLIPVAFQFRGEIRQLTCPFILLTCPFILFD
jgi:hypothetical protein